MMRRGYSSYIPQKVSKKEWCKQRKDLRMNLAARMNEEWRSAYMKEITVLMDAREEGRQEE